MMPLHFEVLVDNEFIRRVRGGNWVLTTELPEEEHHWRWEPEGMTPNRCFCGHSASYHNHNLYVCRGTGCDCRRFAPFVSAVSKEQAEREFSALMDEHGQANE